METLIPIALKGIFLFEDGFNINPGLSNTMWGGMTGPQKHT